MATRPSLRSSDGARPRSKSGAGRPPSSSRSPGPSRPSSAAAADKPVPSFLRPTVSSSMHSSSSSSSLALPCASSSSAAGSKGAAAATARRSADKAPARPVGAPRPITPKDRASAQPVGAPRPITPKDRASAQPVGAPRPITLKDKAPAQPVGVPRPAKAKAPASASLWGAVSPRQLMQRASNAFKASSRSRSKKGKEEAAASASSGGKGGAGASACRAKGQTSRAQHQQQQPETPAEPSPAVTPLELEAEEPVLLESDAAGQNGQDVATSQEAASTDITTVAVRCQEEQVGSGQPKEKAEEEDDVAVEEKIIQVEAEMPDLQEKRPQSSEVVETGTEAHERTDDGSPAVLGEEAATPEGEDELATSAAEEKVVEEIQRAEATENSEANANSEEPDQETSVISEEPKEGTSVVSEEPKEAVDPTTVQKRVEASDEPKTAAGSSVSAPTTPLTEAANYDGNDDVEAAPKQVSASEPVTPVAEGISKGKEVMETQQQSASAPTTPASKQAAIPVDAASASALAFRGRRVRTAMERRSEEEQPKRKEVARSNDVIEEAKSKLMEKRKSKVKALVGAFETVMDMDSPRAS
ncbi:hypothetical protein Zm00014a_024003 [Zea mays]|uniref:Calmodulin-binding domain-containing protein n=1 Tax=Zea mays TaxID=4577 RepID=A0A3L6EJ27_MAIZE|nr:hypothetical protein Zm00014a_024003 [Zea mays]